MARILMIVGSLRRNSFNRQLACEIEKIIGTRAEVTYLDYALLPHMNQDIEFPPTALVARVRSEVEASDGLWVCAPEYNQQIPGVLKNLFDWLSRPYVANDWSSGTAVVGKAATISSASGNGGGSGVRPLLVRLLDYLKMNVVYDLGTGVALSAEAFKTDRLTLTSEDRSALTAQAGEFLAALDRLRESGE